MPVTFQNVNDIIIYALEKIISFARRNHYLFVALCIWWLASIIDLQSGLKEHIKNLKIQVHIAERSVLAEPRDLQ
jgi:hypothetical protein